MSKVFEQTREDGIGRTLFPSQQGRRERIDKDVGHCVDLVVGRGDTSF